MTVDFQEHFWGDKLNGFDVLYQNLKCGSACSKELLDFLRSKAMLEEYNVTYLSKLSRKTSNIQHLGTFHPLWEILKSSTDKLSSLHTQTLQRLNQLIKDINKYCDDHHKKQKQVKSEENSTVDTINELKETFASLNKAKEFYFAKAIEVGRLRRENASQKDIEKVEARMNKACSEYKNFIEKYKKVKDEYEKKFRLSCQNFQKLEEDHLKQMKDYLATYWQILESGHTLIGQVYKEFQNNCNDKTIERLLEEFTKNKGTGSKKPVEIKFEEANINAVQLSVSSQNTLSASSSSLSAKPHSTNFTSSLDLINLDVMSQRSSTSISSSSNINDFGSNFDPVLGNTNKSEGFQKSKKDKSRDKKVKGKADSDDEESNGSVTGSKLDLNNDTGASGSEYFIDAEGFTVRTNKAIKDEDRFYSSSDSDSDSDEEKEKKIFVKINPLKNGTHSASVDQLIASAGALTLAPSSHTHRRSNLSANPSPVLGDGAIKRSVSATQTSFKSKEDNVLFDIFNSNASPGTNNQENSSINGDETALQGTISNLNPLTKSIQSTQTTTSSSTSSDRYAAFSELFAVRADSHSSTLPTTESKPTSSMTISESNILPLPPRTNSVESSSFNAMSMSTSLSKSVSGSFMGSNSFSVYKPLSKPFSSSYSQSMSSNGMMSRAESITSLSSDFRMTPISFTSSRDSSPLTIGMSDTVPIAIAFQESIGACFKSTEDQCKTNVIGCIKIAFSSGITQVFASNPYLSPLKFKLKNANRLDKTILSKDFVSQVESNEEYSVYEMNISNLQAHIKRMYEQTPNARYYNLDIIKYQLRTSPGPKSAPLHLVSYWKCEPNSTNLKIDFKFNPSAFGHTTVNALKNVQFMANVDGNVLSMNSQPEGKWDSLTKQAVWKYNEISQATCSSGLGSIKAKFDISDGPTCPSSIYVQFSCQDSILSGLDFELIGTGYRLSLTKRQFSSGRYFCEPK